MRHWRAIGLGFGVGFLSAMLGARGPASVAQAPPARPAAWEYRSVPMSPGPQDLNGLGKEGWELVAATSYDGHTIPGGLATTVYVFKRPRP